MLRTIGRVDYECKMTEDEAVLQVCLQTAESLMEYRRDRLRRLKNK